MSRKQLYELYRKRWSQMVDKKKMKYIKKALEAKEKYDVSVGVHRGWFHSHSYELINLIFLFVVDFIQ